MLNKSNDESFRKIGTMLQFDVQIFGFMVLLMKWSEIGRGSRSGRSEHGDAEIQQKGKRERERHVNSIGTHTRKPTLLIELWRSGGASVTFTHNSLNDVSVQMRRRRERQKGTEWSRKNTQFYGPYTEIFNFHTINVSPSHTETLASSKATKSIRIHIKINCEWSMNYLLRWVSGSTTVDGSLPPACVIQR